MKRNRAFHFLLAVAGILSVAAACRVLRPPARVWFPATDAGNLRRADRLAKLGNWDAAGTMYAGLEDRFQRKHDVRNALYAHVSRYGKEEESSDLQAVSQELAQTLRLPLVQNDPALLQRCLEIKAHIDLNLDGVSARPSLERLEQVARQRKDADAASRASGELGIVAFLEGNPKDARNRVLRAIYNAFASGDTGAEIRYVSMLGQGLAESEKPRPALLALNRALAISEKTADSGFPKLVVSGKASALTQLGRYAEAHDVIDTGLRYARAHHFVGYEIDMLSQSGQLATAQGEVSKAIALYQSAVGLAKQIHFNRGLSEVSAKLASLYQRAGLIPQAISAQQTSIEAHLQMGEVYELPHHLALKANLQQAVGERRAAERTYDEAEKIVSTMLRNSPTPSIKRSVVSAMSEVYLGHFRLAAADNNLADAYRVIEEARGRVAADRLRSAVQDSRPRPEITAAERAIASLQVRLFEAQDPRQRKELSEAIAMREEQTPFEDSATNVNGDASLRDLQAALAPHEAVLEYVLDEPTSSCLVIQATAVRLARLPGRKTISDLVSRETSALQARSLATREGAALYSAAIAPFANLIEGASLIVIPDGELHAIPFAALVEPQNSYLLQKHQIDYSPSGAVLALLRRRQSQDRKRLVAVGDVAYGEEAKPVRGASFFRGLESLRRRSLGPLPATQEEVKSVAATLRDLNGVVLSGKAATESNFKREASKAATVIHLAVHAFADKEYPDRAGLVFAAEDPAEDGVLQVREIRRLPLNGTSLVTLSACDTSAGRVEGEEGASTIVSAFLYAGSRTAVASFWAIEDSSTSELMKVFYGELERGKTKSEALRTAQLELLKRGEETKPPFFWAAFGLNGDGSGTISNKAQQ